MNLGELIRELEKIPESKIMEVTIESSHGEYEPQSIVNVRMAIVANKLVIVILAH